MRKKQEQRWRGEGGGRRGRTARGLEGCTCPKRGACRVGQERAARKKSNSPRSAASAAAATKDGSRAIEAVEAVGAVEGMETGAWSECDCCYLAARKQELVVVVVESEREVRVWPVAAGP